MTGSRTRERGAALVIVAATLSVLSVLAFATGERARAVTGDATASLWRVQADAALEGAIVRAVVALNAAQLANDPVKLEPMDVGDLSVRLRVWREEGRVDVNASAPEVLESVFAAAGLGRTAAAAAAKRMREERDAQRRFGAVAELAQVEGLTEAFVRCLTPVLTVFSPLGEPDPAAAAPFLRRALVLPAADGAVRIRLGEAVTVATNLEDAGRTRSLQWTVRLTGDAARPLDVLDVRGPAEIDGAQPGPHCAGETPAW